MKRRDEIGPRGRPRPADGTRAADERAGPARRFLSVWYQCCHTYGRLYRNAAGTKYEGRCPRCGAHAEAIIGPGGTNQRIFRAR